MASLYADPTITINAVAQSFKRTGSGSNSGAFATADGTHKLQVSHQLGNSYNQSMLRLDRTQIVANPLTTGDFFEATDACWFVSKTPKVGSLTIASEKQLLDGFIAFLSASSGAALTSLLGREN
jgi:hypothetical protein